MSYHDIKFDRTVMGVGQGHGEAAIINMLQTNLNLYLEISPMHL